MTTITPPTERVDSFGILLTEQWSVLPVDPTEFGRYRQQVLATASGIDGWTRADTRRLEVLLTKVRGDIGRRGAQFAAFFFDTGVPAGQPMNAEHAKPLVASLTFGVHNKVDFDTELDLTLQVLYAAFAHRRDDDESSAYRSTDVERPAVIEMPIGRAVHLRRLYEPRRAITQAAPFFAETFITPVGDAGDACGILQFATTNLDEARQFSRMFRRLADTATLFAGDGETQFNGSMAAR